LYIFIYYADIEDLFIDVFVLVLFVCLFVLVSRFDCHGWQLTRTTISSFLYSHLVSYCLKRLPQDFFFSIEFLACS